MCWIKFIAMEQHSEEVSRGQKEIRPIHGKIGSSVAIKIPSPDATAGSGSCPSADCQSGGAAASVCATFPRVFLNTRHCLCETPSQDPVTWTGVCLFLCSNNIL